MGGCRGVTRLGRTSSDVKQPAWSEDKAGWRGWAQPQPSLQEGRRPCQCQRAVGPSHTMLPPLRPPRPPTQNTKTAGAQTTPTVPPPVRTCPAARHAAPAHCSARTGRCPRPAGPAWGRCPQCARRARASRCRRAGAPQTRAGPPTARSPSAAAQQQQRPGVRAGGGEAHVNSNAAAASLVGQPALPAQKRQTPWPSEPRRRSRTWKPRCWGCSGQTPEEQDGRAKGAAGRGVAVQRGVPAWQFAVKVLPRPHLRAWVVYRRRLDAHHVAAVAQLLGACTGWEACVCSMEGWGVAQ
jgi:hypothetical protein